MLKKLLATLAILSSSVASYAGDESDSSVFIYDSAGNGLSSTSNALNSFLTNATLAVTQSGTWITGRTWSLLNTTDSVDAVQSGTWTVQQGATPTAIANAWPVKMTDGTNNATIKAASVPPVVTDTAVVTSERPDNVGTVTMSNVSCSTSSTTLLAAATATMFLSIRNPVTATATVWIRFDGSAATAAVPSIDLPPGAEWTGFAFGTSFLPSSQFNCISGGAAASSLSYFYK